MRAPVYLVRHGQSEWNVRRLTQGQTAHPALTDLGREQAAAAAELVARDLDLLGRPPARLVTSDLVRAVETAAILGGRLGLVASPDPRLREQHLGALEGLGYEESWTRAGAHDWSDPEAPVAGGESVADVRRRVAAVLGEVDPLVPTVLVSHGDTIRSAVAHVLGQPLTDVPWVEVPNGSVARCDGGVTWLAEPAGGRHRLPGPATPPESLGSTPTPRAAPAHVDGRGVGRAEATRTRQP